LKFFVETTQVHIRSMIFCMLVEVWNLRMFHGWLTKYKTKYPRWITAGSITKVWSPNKLVHLE
jgi:hypothetical protein